MEESIGKLGKTLGGFCANLQNSCHALKQSVERRPIPLDSASTNFVRCLNGRVSSTSTDLNLLHSMAFDTVSFEELLGHCNQVYNKNYTDILDLEDRLFTFGYSPHDAEPEQVEDKEDCLLEDSPPQSSLKAIQDDNLFDDSMSLQNLGLSDACLATIASQANDNVQMEEEYQASTKFFELPEDELESCKGSGSFLTVSKDDYASIPSYMKILASWEDVTAAVEKLNASLAIKEKLQGSYFFGQDEIASLGLGPKGRSFVLMLLRMNKLVIENIDGSVCYKVL
ncbi:hypothetical protein DCAR_0625679 [Daucus carota subsp. sativus]|uniref:Spindle and kinetochore-associated protein 3 n=1 Tax=Daucus carota subsp. sativus TaxID=79200 RepID=A0AAF0XGZ5_DAUCS|nr:PREDICTED: uncharacterized protein LOC108225342 isoform X1 [Daucus carota subsp. sativus]WOH06256.1 hypothetical protein DCAR_0625679 [Daucus carota subsp. sativus]